MKKKGFTLVELLAVIAILAILIIIALPNIMSLFNQSKQNSFETELKNIYKTAEQEWMKDSMFDTRNIVYARCKSADCTNQLSLSGREEIEYYIEVDKAGKVIKYFATDSTYQYEYNGTGLKIEEIGGSKQVANLQSKDVLAVTCDGASKNGRDVTNGAPIEGSNIAEDCSGNEVANTIPSNATGLYKIMAEQAYLDNAKSPNVTRCQGVNFNEISSDSNGKGVYEITSTKDDAYPIYYYRGEVTNNNVKFGGFCWKAVRMTNTGGVKLIYNGRPNSSGQCINTTGESTQIGISEFNNNYDSPAYVGYMYGTKDGSPTGTPYKVASKSLSASSAGIKFGRSVTYSGGTYILTNIMEVTDTNYNHSWSFNNNHYTCFSTSNTCTTVYYVYYINAFSNTSYYYYIPISGLNSNGKELIDMVIENMFRNDRDSKAKTEIDAWYRDNMTSYTGSLEDTIYCNDRSISAANGWSPTGIMNYYLYFNAGERTTKPSLECKRTNDKFTVSSSIGNGKLKYPVGLLSTDEVMYAGGLGGRYIDNTAYYLYTNQDYWTSSPSVFFMQNFEGIQMNARGRIDTNYGHHDSGLRPVVSLSKNTNVSGGDGTANNPYVIE